MVVIRQISFNGVVRFPVYPNVDKRPKQQGGVTKLPAGCIEPYPETDLIGAS